VFELLEKAGWQYSIGVRMIKNIRAEVEPIDGDAWQRIDYPEEGEAQIAETEYDGRRLIVRRARLVGAQAELWPHWRHFAFITNRTDQVEIVEAEHRDHAVVEQVIADLKDQALVHFPSGHNAHSAWTVLATLAHNLLRWTQLLGLPDSTVRAARTPAPPAARHPWPTDPPRTRLEASPARPLALARRLHHRPDEDPRAPCRLTAPRAPHDTNQTDPRRDHRQRSGNQTPEGPDATCTGALIHG
jgi:hypothetical protein